MGWEFHQGSGQMFRDGKYVAQGYSGKGEGRDNPSYQRVPDVGPIPQGAWTIIGPPFDSEFHGPYVLRLSPAPDTITFGRSGFLIHGDSIAHPGMASEGCIVLPRFAREDIWNSQDTALTVIA